MWTGEFTAPSKRTWAIFGRRLGDLDQLVLSLFISFIFICHPFFQKFFLSLQDESKSAYVRRRIMKVRTECYGLARDSAIFVRVHTPGCPFSSSRRRQTPFFFLKNTAAQNKPHYLLILPCRMRRATFLDARVFARLLLLSLDFLRVELSNICQS